VKLIELRQDRVDNLRRLIKERETLICASRNLIVDDPIQGDCETVVTAIIEEHSQQRRNLGPALFFLDQFGYSSIPMDLIKRILGHKVCEVFSYLNWNMLCPYLADPTKESGITRAFGGDEWKEVIPLAGVHREERFRELYLAALRERAGAGYAYPFAMRDRNHRVIYWLFFCTRSHRGLEEMKKAMRTVDPTGGFEFSDKYAQQAGVLFNYKEEDLIRDLSDSLDGRTMTVDQVHDYVLLHTPGYLYKSVLQKMERSDLVVIVDVPLGRRSGDFSCGQMKVRFARKAAPPEPLLFDC
jgi:three-Cys-motif partner protein